MNSEINMSFVIPVYGSPDSLGPLCERIESVCLSNNYNFEIILVDDRCPFGSWAIIENISRKKPNIHGILLSRNFGQHAAIHAGLFSARGEWIVVMDCDLQDRPEEVPMMLAKAKEGFDIVRAQRINRNDSFFRRTYSRIFYSILSFLTDTEQSFQIANFGIYERRVIESLLKWDEDLKYFPAIVSWIGFEQTKVPVMHDQRYSGKSSYNLAKLLKLAAKVVLGFSTRPLSIMIFFGMSLALISFIVSLIVFFLAINHLIIVEGWGSLMLSVWFLSGCILTGLGLSGLYIGRILVEVKGRPTFVIDKKVSSSL